MKANESTSKGFNKLFTASAVSLLLAAAQGSFAANGSDSANAGQQGSNQANNQTPEFSQIDSNSNDSVEWSEIQSEYDNQLSEAGWNEEQVLQRFDQNGDDQLGENEYRAFALQLQAATGFPAGADQRGQADSQGEQQNAQTQQGQDGSNQDTAAGATRGLAQEQSTAGNQNEQNQSTLARERQQGDEMASDMPGQQGDSDSVYGQQESGGYTAQTSESNSEQNLSQSDSEAQMSNESATETERNRDAAIAGTSAQNQQSQDQQNQDAQNQGEQNPVNDDEAQREAMTAGAGPEQSQDQQNQQAQDSSLTAAVVSVTTVEDVPIADIEGRSVLNLQGDEIGDVQDVVVSEDGEQTGLVVSVGGFLGIGAKDILVDVNNVQVTEENIVWQIDADQNEIKELPEYNEQDYVSVR